MLHNHKDFFESEGGPKILSIEAQIGLFGEVFVLNEILIESSILRVVLINLIISSFIFFLEISQTFLEFSILISE